MKNPTSKLPRFRNRKAGFTLVELLVSIVIVIALAALSFVIYGKATASSQRAVCVNIMRQFGTAMHGYLSDNHDRMPNVQVNLQKPNYRHENDHHIFAALYPYLGLETRSEVTALPDSLVCPAWRKRFPNWNSDGTGKTAGNCYFLNQDQSIDGRRIYGTQSKDGSENEYGGMSYAKIVNGTDETPVSSILFLADGHHPTEKEDPVHGAMRNYLFLDFHVESVRASEVDLFISP